MALITIDPGRTAQVLKATGVVEVGLVQTGTSRRTVLRNTVKVYTSDVK